MKRFIIGILLLVLVTLSLSGCGGTPALVPDNTHTPELADTPEDLELIVIDGMTLDQLYAAITLDLKNSSVIYPAQNVVRQPDGEWRLTAKEGGCPGDLDAQFQVLLFTPSRIADPYYTIFFDNQTIIYDAWFKYENATAISKLLWTTETTDEPKPKPAVEEPGPALGREAMIEIFKANASATWGNDYEMVKYEVDNQTEAYDWVIIQTVYPAIMGKAEDKWYPDYEMVKYEYENQVGAYEWVMRQTAYPDIMEEAKQKWGNDYEMVKYEYERQVEAYEALQ